VLQTARHRDQQLIPNRVTEAIIHIFEAIEVKKEHGELIILMLLRPFDDELQVLCEQRAIRQVRQRVVERRVTEVIFAFLKLRTDSFLFGNVAVQLFDVTFGLFRARAFGFGASSLSFRAFAFGLFGLFGARFNFIKVLVIGEVNDLDDRRADDQNREARALK